MKVDRIVAVLNDKIVYKNGNSCIKTFGRDYPKKKVIEEALCYAKAEEIFQNVPILEGVSRQDGKWAITYEFIKGKTLRQMISENPEKTEELLQGFVSVQIEIHKKSGHSFKSMKAEMSENILNCRLDAEKKYALHSMLERMEMRSLVCHGSFTPEKVIAGEGGNFVTGWSRTLCGEPLADAALTYLLFKLKGEHTAAKEYLELYCKMSNSSKEEIIRWIPLAAASRSVYEKETARNELLSWTNVVD